MHLQGLYPYSLRDEHEPPARTALRASLRARQALAAGVTTIRCVHEQHQVDLVLREAATQGWIKAPRILAGGRALTTTGGHGHGLGCVVVDGHDAFLHAARTELAAGADHVKVFLTGGLARPASRSTPSSSPTRSSRGSCAPPPRSRPRRVRRSHRRGPATPPP